MGLTNLLEFCLNLANSFVFELLDFLKSAPNHAKCLWINSSSCQNLVGLSILGLKTLLNGLKLLLHNQVAKTGLAVHVIHNLVEPLKQLLFLGLEVIETLQLHLILPLNVLVFLLRLDNILLLLSELMSDLIVQILFITQSDDFLLDVLQRLDNHVVCRGLEGLLTVGICLSKALSLEISSKLRDHVHV